MMYLSDETMLAMLAKVQPLQAEIIKTGHSAHIDASVHEDIWDATSTHISIDVCIFYGHSLVGSFCFSPNDTEEQLEATYASLAAFVHTL